MMKGAIFDLDGTLINSMIIWGDMWKQFLIDAQIEVPDRFVQIITPLGADGTATYLQNLGLNKPKEEILKELGLRMYDAYANRILAKPFVAEYLQSLKEKGIPMGVLTATPQVLARPCLERLGLYHYFDFSLSCDDLNLSKSKPEIYGIVCEKLGVAPANEAFFDDNITALRAVKEAGLIAVGVYDSTSESDRETITQFVDRYIESFEEML
jgi:HAD superfamily hydrolase (TIGR01509 family)